MITAFYTEEVRKMVIYITSDEKKDLLNRMSKQYDWELLVEVMEKGSLNKFITDRLQVINSIRYLVIERSCIKENEQQLHDLLDTIHAIWSPQIILLEEILQDDDGEYQKVIYQNNITSLYKYQDNIEVNIEYLLKGEKIPAENVYSGTWIGVMSANSGAGCTHVAIDLATFIGSQGQSVCYVEANDSGDLGAMAQFYEFEQVEDNHYRKDGIDYWHQMIDPEKKFAVLDIGKYNAAKMEMFNQCKIKILVSDGKPYRMADAMNVLRYVQDDSVRLWLNYIHEEEFDKINERYLSSVLNPIGRIGWHKNMFHGADALYQEVLQSYIQFVPKKTPKLTFLFKTDVLKDKIQKKVEKKLLEVKSDDAEQMSSADIEENNQDVSMLDDTIQVQTTEVDLAESDVKGQPEENENQQDYSCDVKTAEEVVSEAVEDDYSDLEQEVIVVDKLKASSKSNKLVKNIMLLLVVMGMGVMVPTVVKNFKMDWDSSFNTPDTQTTELLDENLNINDDIKISVLEVEGADGYEVSYSTDKEFPEERTVIVEVQTADKAVESLSAGKTYYVRVRAFKFNENGTKVYGEYTEIQKIET